MRILIACEFSGIVRDAFASLGHYVISCDLLPSESPNGFHYQGNVLDLIDKERFDLMIAHPPCTYICVSGARWFQQRMKEQEEALAFVCKLLHSPISRICLENPIGVISTYIQKPTQIIQPWMFGHPETKATCLWLHNLPKLEPTNIVEGRNPRIHLESPNKDRWKNRSRTYKGIARAMAEQWGRL